MINYNNGKIYKIEPICDHEENEIYIGSTTKKYLSQRMTSHRNSYNQWKNGKYHKFTVFDLFDKYGIENCQIYLLESVNANTKDELLAREGYFIKTLNCVNKIINGRTKKEYYRDNENKIKEYAKQYQKENESHYKNYFKQYYENNKDNLTDYNKQYRENNKDKLNENNMQYYEKNKEKIANHRAKIIECECGKAYTWGHKLRHFDSQKHKNYIKEQNI
jgi:hypothetical protein